MGFRYFLKKIIIDSGQQKYSRAESRANSNFAVNYSMAEIFHSSSKKKGQTVFYTFLDQEE